MGTGMHNRLLGYDVTIFTNTHLHHVGARVAMKLLHFPSNFQRVLRWHWFPSILQSKKTRQQRVRGREAEGERGRAGERMRGKEGEGETGERERGRGGKSARGKEDEGERI